MGWIIGLVGRGSTATIARILIGMITAVLLSGGWGVVQAQKARAASAKLIALNVDLRDKQAQISAQAAEIKRRAARMAQLDDIAIERFARKEAWKIEALKWKNQLIGLKNTHPEIQIWANATYPAELN